MFFDTGGYGRTDGFVSWELEMRVMQGGLWKARSRPRSHDPANFTSQMRFGYVKDHVAASGRLPHWGFAPGPRWWTKLRNFFTLHTHRL